MTEYLRPQEAASWLRVDVTRLAAWANAGHLTTFRTIGGHRRYVKDEIAALATLQAMAKQEEGA